MSKKTISFQNPSNSANSLAAPGLTIVHSRADLAVDQWINQPEEIVETSLASSIKTDEARRQGNRVKNSSRDEACEEVVIP